MKKIIIIIIPFLIMIGTIPIRYNSFLLDFAITPILFLLVSLILYKLKILNPKTILLNSLIGLIAVFFLMYLLDGTPSIIFIPNFICYGISIVLSYLINNSKLFIKKGILLFAYFIFLFIYIKVLFFYVANYQNAGTFSGIINTKSKLDLKAMDDNGNQLEFNNNKIFVLDFWFAGCGACLNEFPEFEKLYLQNKKNPLLEFASIGIPIKKQGDLEKRFIEKMEEKKYTFPVYTSVNKIDSMLEITSYPTIIICKKDSLIFKGSLEFAKKYLLKNNLISK